MNKEKKELIIKFLLLSSAAITLSYGWITNTKNFAICGAIIYLASLTIGLVSIIISSKKYKAEIVEESQNKNKFLKTISNIVEGAILLAGLIATPIHDSLFGTTGSIIWIGTILIYFLCGAIVSWIANLPMRMTYGGWKTFNRFKKRKRD